MFPCKDCLIIPICKNNSIVKCSILYQWLAGDNRIYKPGVSKMLLQKCFPGLSSFRRYPSRRDDIVYLEREEAE